MPDFETRSKDNLEENEEGYFYQNPLKNTYSFEVCFKEENKKIYCGYKDPKNKFYAGFAGNLLQIHSVIDGEDTVIFEKKFKYSYQKDSIKTIRIQISKNLMNLYFNDIELGYDIYLRSDGSGNIGFEKDLDFTFFAVSKYSFGNSDKEEVKIDKVLASNFDSASVIGKNDCRCDFIEVNNKTNLIYYIYSKEAGNYHLDMNVNSLFKHIQINLKVNDEQFSGEFDLSNVEEYRNIANVSLKEGINKIEISSDDAFSFSFFNFEKIVENCRDFEENLTQNSSDLMHIGRPVFTEGGLYFDNDRNFTYVDSVYTNFDVTADVVVRGNPTFEEDFAALVVLNKNYGKRNQFENAFSLDGILFGFNAKHLFVIEANFDKTKVLKRVEVNGDVNKVLRIVKEDHKMNFYENENLFYSLDLTHQNLRGRIGLYNVHTSVYFRNLIIKEVPTDEIEK
jgi:hypothetical protein